MGSANVLPVNNNIEFQSVLANKESALYNDLSVNKNTENSLNDAQIQAAVKAVIDTYFDSFHGIPALVNLFDKPALVKLFNEYLTSDYLANASSFYKDYADWKTNTSNILSEKVNELVNTYSFPMNENDVDSTKLKTSTSEVIATRTLLNDSLKDRELAMLIALKALPEFLKSSKFTSFDDAEKVHPTAKVASPRSPSTKNNVSKATANGYSQEKWMALFLAIVEVLPVSIAVSKVNKNEKGLPLIHVNAAFEAMTGYDRKDILGRGAGFLQRRQANAEEDSPNDSQYTEMSSVQIASKALGAAQPVKVFITDFKQNGEQFKNLLAMKPIFDQDGTYSFVIGFQLEASDDKCTANALGLVDLLLKYMPDTLVV